MTQRYCLTLDLKDDPELIAEYRRHHREFWPEVAACMRDCGILDCELYQLGTRLMLLLETTSEFSFENKSSIESNNAKVQAWEQLMWKFQQPLPMAKTGEKWIAMERIFKLEADK
jgi:L-rhamnose mutarotase